MKTVKVVSMIFVLMFGLSACCGLDLCNTLDLSNDGSEDIAKVTPMVYTVPELETVPVEVRTIKIAEKIMFAFDSSDIDQKGMEIINKVASFMDKYPDTTLVIEGYTCPIGTDDYNMGLSMRRATAVEKALLEAGVDKKAITAVAAFGENNIISEIKKENRRVLILSLDEL
jgi:outer membrane protein OmpA-like peptidoglycan-associated protein